MGQVEARLGGGSGEMSAAEALRFCREFKRLKKEAGILPYDPRDKDAIRRGFFGDFYGMPLDAIDRSRKVVPPTGSPATRGMPLDTIDRSRDARPPS